MLLRGLEVGLRELPPSPASTSLASLNIQAQAPLFRTNESEEMTRPMGAPGARQTQTSAQAVKFCVNAPLRRLDYLPTASWHANEPLRDERNAFSPNCSILP
jgi:hypothetical protein